jgi:uncharacterized protein YjbJ (UPF0337 family)
MGEGPKDLKNDDTRWDVTRRDDVTARGEGDVVGRPVADPTRPAGTAVTGYGGGLAPAEIAPPVTTTPAPGTTGTTGTTMPTAGTGTYGDAKGLASGDAKVTTSGETAQIRAEIEETRANITDTVEEISARLSPRNIMADATEKTRERVRQFADTASERATEFAGQTREATGRAVDSARENPWVAALAVAGIGAAAWWMMSRRDDYDEYGPYDEDFYTEESLYYADDLDPMIYDDERTDRMESNRMAGATIPLVLAGIGVGAWLWNRQQSAHRYESYGSGYPLSAGQNSWGDVGYGEEAGSYRSFEGAGSSWGEDAAQAAERAGGKVSDAAGRARHAASDAAERARHAASDAAERARHVANDVGERTRGMAVRARRQVGQAGERAKTQLEHWMEHNPLAVGLVAMGVGVAVGLAVPESRQEHRLMGETRDRVLGRAQAAASGAVDRAKGAAKEAVDAAKDAANEAVDKSKDAAQRAASDVTRDL